MKKNILIGLMALFSIALIGYTNYQNNVSEQNAGEIKLIDEQEETNEIKDINEQEKSSVEEFIDNLFN
jgi:hypothetical protein